MLDKKIIEKIETVAKKYNLLAVYLFGSQVTGDIGPLSDFDFGVVTNKNLSVEEEIALHNEFDSLFDKPVDVIIINDAGLDIAYEIIRTGVKIYVENDEKLIDFEYKLMREYLDFEYILEMYSRETRRWINEIKGSSR